MDKVKTRLIQSDVELYVCVTLLSGWPIQSTSDKLFYKEGSDPMDVIVVVNGLEIALKDIDTLQVENFMFQKRYDPTVFGNYTWHRLN